MPEPTTDAVEEQKRCKYGHGTTTSGCPLGYPGCLCADEAMAEDLPATRGIHEALSQFDQARTAREGAEHG